MKMHLQHGLLFPVAGQAAEALTAAGERIKQAEAMVNEPASVEKPEVVSATIHAETKKETPAPEVIPPVASAATTTTSSVVQVEQPKMSIGQQIRALFGKLCMLLLVRPLKAVGNVLAYPFRLLMKRMDEYAAAHPYKATALAVAAILGAVALLGMLGSTPTSHVVRVHGGLENGGFFSRLGFNMDNNKITELEVSGFAGNRTVKAKALVDGKGRYYTPGQTGGWVRQK